MLAVADDRNAAAAGVAQLGEEVDLLDTLAVLPLVRRHFVEQLRVRNDDEPPLLCRDPNRVDMPEPAVVLELRVIVIQDVKVREPLTLRHKPANRVRDIERAVASIRRCGDRQPCLLDVDAGVDELLQFLAGQPERGVAETDDIPLGQQRDLDTLLIEEGAVRAV